MVSDPSPGDDNGESPPIKAILERSFHGCFRLTKHALEVGASALMTREAAT